MGFAIGLRTVDVVPHTWWHAYVGMYLAYLGIVSNFHAVNCKGAARLTN